MISSRQKQGLPAFFAVAKGDIPEEAFYKMGRRRAGKNGIVLSWSGTAFEYLLPELFLYSYDNLLWSETSKQMLEGQIRFGELAGIPWGVSESGYNSRDMSLNYRYHAFGIPYHRIKRERPGDRVVAPYASIMGICIYPKPVVDNLMRLKAEGVWGEYGFFEAIDYTPGRKGVVESVMAHHLGMSLTALANFRLNYAAAKAFSLRPESRAYDTLLAEKPGVKKVKKTLITAADLNLENALSQSEASAAKAKAAEQNAENDEIQNLNL